MLDDIVQSLATPGLWADLILVVHALIVVFVIGGQLMILIGGWYGWLWVRNLWFRLIHLITIVIVVTQAWLGRLCPLTIWEQQLRRAAGQAHHDQSFIEYWISRFLYLDLPWWVFVAAYTLFAMLVVWSWWRLPPRKHIPNPA